jgi:hypothetical protein
VSYSDTIFASIVALGVAGLTIDGAVSILPKPRTSQFFEVQSVRAERDGVTAQLWVDRIIKAPVHMSYTVRVQEWTPGGWRQFCRADGGPFLYDPEATIDRPVSLDWWTNGICPVLPDGRARIVTTWQPQFKGAVAVSYTAEVSG